MKTNLSVWRFTARGIISRVILENKGLGEKELRALIKDAYPFGARKYHPYKIWLSEQTRAFVALGFIKQKGKRKTNQDPGPEFNF